MRGDQPPFRRTLGPAWIVNAFNELVSIPGYADLRSDRLNLLKARDLDPANWLCFDRSCGLAEAAIPVQGDNNPFFPMFGQAVWAALTIDELKTAKREKRDPALTKVRLAATEADEFD